MTVEELINELMASCESLDDQVILCDSGIVTRVSGHTLIDGGAVYLNEYQFDDEANES